MFLRNIVSVLAISQCWAVAFCADPPPTPLTTFPGIAKPVPVELKTLVLKPHVVFSGKDGNGITRYSPDGSLLAVSGRGQKLLYSKLKIYYPHKGQEKFYFNGEFVGLQFSPDIKLLLVWDIKSVYIINLDTAKHLATLSHENVRGVQFFSEEKRLVTCAHGVEKHRDVPISMKFWDSETWKPIETAIDPLFPLFYPTLSADGKSLAGYTFRPNLNDEKSNHELGDFKIWNVATGKGIFDANAEGLSSHDKVMLGFTHDSKALVAGIINYNGEELVLGQTIYRELPNGKAELFPAYLNPYDHVRWIGLLGLIFNSDKQEYPQHHIPRRVQLVNNRWIVWDVAQRKKITDYENTTGWNPKSAQKYGVHIWNPVSADLIPVLENGMMVLHDVDPPTGEINLWDVKSAKLSKTLKIAQPIQQMSLAKDGKTMAVLCYELNPKTLKRNKQVSLWDLPTGKQLYVLNGHNDLVSCLAFSADGKMLVTASGLSNDKLSGLESGEIKLWDAGTGELRRTLVEKGHEVNAVALSPDGKQLATGTYSSTIRLWNTGTGEKEREFVLSCPRPGYESLGEIRCLGYTPDGKTLVVVSGYNSDGNVSLWDVSKGTYLFDDRFLNDRADVPTHSLLFTSDGKSLLNGNRFLDLATRQRLAQPKLELTGSTIHAALSSNILAVANSEQGYNAQRGVIQLWDLKSGKLAGMLRKATGPIQSVLFSPDGTSLITGGTTDLTSVLRLIELDTGRELVTLPNVTKPHFSENGDLMLTRELVTGGDVWTIRETRTGRELGTLTHAQMYLPQFSPDGKTLATHGMNEVWIWNLKEHEGK